MNEFKLSQHFCKERENNDIVTLFCKKKGLKTRHGWWFCIGSWDESIFSTFGCITPQPKDKHFHILIQIKLVILLAICRRRVRV